MDRDGAAFELRKAIPTIATYLGVTRFTIHNYLNEIRGKIPPDSADETEEASSNDTHPQE
jgi:hypothetical protein